MPDETLEPTSAEQKLIDAAACGQVADYSSGNPEQDRPAEGASWGLERAVRAAVIYALATGSGPDWPVHGKGVRLKGAKIEGALDFEAAKIACPLGLVNCRIASRFVFRDASAHSIVLDGSFLAGGLDGEGLRLEHGLSLGRGFVAKGGVWLAGATVGGQLDCAGGSFENSGGRALGMDGIRVEGAVFLGDGFAAKGEVRLMSATVGGLDCSGGSFENPSGAALTADGINVKGAVFFRDKFAAKGEVGLLGATVGGQLDCSGGGFENSYGAALAMDGIDVNGSMFLGDKFTARGEVRLPGATVGNQLSCSGGRFENPNGDALTMDQVSVKGSVLLQSNFTAKGEVRMGSARVGGQLSCVDGSFENPGGKALSMQGIDVKRDVFLGGKFSAKGDVRLVGATVGGQLECSGSFESPDGYALMLDTAVVKGLLIIHGRFRAEGGVDLSNTTVGAFVYDETVWPRGGLSLKGFTYGSIHGSRGANKRLRWLDGMKEFSPQPYEQLARVLRQMGHEHDAREVLIAKQRRMRDRGGLSWGSRLGNWLLEWTVGYGYRARCALWWMLVFFALGSGFAGLGWRAGLFVPSAQSEPSALRPAQAVAPRFHATLYSLDRFSLPPLDLGQKAAWQPHERGNCDPWYWAFQIYFILHSLAGWTLTGLLIAALTGIIKKD